MQTLKKLLRKDEKPLQQIARRLHEISKFINDDELELIIHELILRTHTTMVQL